MGSAFECDGVIRRARISISRGQQATAPRGRPPYVNVGPDQDARPVAKRASDVRSQPGALRWPSVGHIAWRGPFKLRRGPPEPGANILHPLDLLQPSEDILRRCLFLEGQLCVGVQVPSDFDQLQGELLDTRVNRRRLD